jgi:hypothetical protein
MVITFQIPASLIPTFISARAEMKGIHIPAKNMTNGEVGYLYIAHSGHLDREKVLASRWVLSCFLNKKLSQFSPFEGGNPDSCVITKFNPKLGLLQAELAVSSPVDEIGEDF